MFARIEGKDLRFINTVHCLILRREYRAPTEKCFRFIDKLPSPLFFAELIYVK